MDFTMDLKELVIIFQTHQSRIFRICFLLLVCLPLLYLITFLIRKFFKKRFSPQVIMLITKLIKYSGTIIIILTILRELGFTLTTLLGAAGIAGIAIGFAAQTSLSNIISGLFLIWEKPFQIGDLIEIENSKGIVHSMDLLSVYLTTFDNVLIRIPNEKLIKASFTNITRFPIRRLDLNINVAYKEDIDKVMKALQEVANANPYSLDEPEPIIIFKGFGDSALEFMLGAWFAKEDYRLIRNSILKEIKAKFDEEGIEIPFPHRTLYTGLATEPFPIKLVDEREKPE